MIFFTNTFRGMILILSWVKSILFDSFGNNGIHKMWTVLITVYFICGIKCYIIKSFECLCEKRLTQNLRHVLNLIVAEAGKRWYWNTLIVSQHRTNQNYWDDFIKRDNAINFEQHLKSKQRDSEYWVGGKLQSGHWSALRLIHRTLAIVHHHLLLVVSNTLRMNVYDISLIRRKKWTVFLDW